MSTARPVLAAAHRTELGKANAHLRRAGRIPAVVFGHAAESVSVSLDAHEFDLMRRHVGANTLLDLVVDGDRPTPVLISGVQIHKITRQPIHVDLQRVLMSEELTVDVPIHGTGDAEAVDRHGGTIFHAVDHVRVRARADNLPQHVEADLTVLVAFDSVIHARDLQIPAGVALVTDPDDIVIRVLPPRVVEEEAAAAAPAEEAVGEEAAAEASATE